MLYLFVMDTHQWAQNLIEIMISQYYSNYTKSDMDSTSVTTGFAYVYVRETENSHLQLDKNWLTSVLLDFEGMPAAGRRGGNKEESPFVSCRPGSLPAGNENEITGS